MCFLCGSTENLEYDHEPQQARNPQESAVRPMCKDCHAEKTATDAKFDDGWRPFTSVFNDWTYAAFHLQPREKPLNLKLTPPGGNMRNFSVDFDKHYRHALMYPGMTWSVFAPTDSYTPPTAQLAEWSWVDNGKGNPRLDVYVGPGWYCRRLVRDMLDRRSILSRKYPALLPTDHRTARRLLYCPSEQNTRCSGAPGRKDARG